MRLKMGLLLQCRNAFHTRVSNLNSWIVELNDLNHNKGHVKRVSSKSFIWSTNYPIPHYHLKFHLLFCLTSLHIIIEYFWLLLLFFSLPYYKHKLDFKYHECLILVYSSSQKAYKCLSPDGRVWIYTCCV